MDLSDISITLWAQSVFRLFRVSKVMKELILIHKKIIRIMAIDDPRTYKTYEEDLKTVTLRFTHKLNVERLQDEMRRIKSGMPFDAMAQMIPEIVANWAGEYPTGGILSSQNIYDFLKLKSPSTPTVKRRLAFHAFMMIVDETYRGKWDRTYFVKRTGLALCDFFATERNFDPYHHSLNLQKSAGLYTYLDADHISAPTWKKGFEKRCLLLCAPKDLPFLLAYDFDYLRPEKALSELSADEIKQYGKYVGQSMDLDARVGFYIPKRSSTEGILLLNSFKWDWPTIYGSIFNYVTRDKIDDSAGEIVDIVLSDVNSYSEY